MFADSVDRQEHKDSALALRNPKLYELTMEARREYPPMKIIVDFFKNLLAKLARKS